MPSSLPCWLPLRSSKSRAEPVAVSAHILVVVANRRTDEQRALFVAREPERLTEPHEVAAYVEEILGPDWFVQSV
jgi:hypothetical protein